MRKPSLEQLALLDLPPAPRPEADRARAKRRANASTAARYCSALLAELDRIQAAQTEAARHDRAEHLAQLFEAAERAHQARSQAPTRTGRRAG